MTILLWIAIGGAALVLLALGVLVVAAVLASRSRRTPKETPTQQTENPYRKFYP